MKTRKKVLTITLTTLLYLAAVVLGMSTVFRVSAVSVELSVTSQDAKGQTQAVQEELLSLYQNESIFSVKRADAENVLKKYPYLRVTEFRKSYPDIIRVKIVEDTEFYAVQTGEEYYIVSGEGIVVEKRSSPVNRLDNANNLIVKGLQTSGSRGGYLTGDGCWDSIYALCQNMQKELGEIRKNVLEVEVMTRAPETFYRITMREGVRIYLKEPDIKSAEIAKVAVNAYLSLSDEERTLGCITLHDIDGTLTFQYQKNDNFSF